MHEIKFRVWEPEAKKIYHPSGTMLGIILEADDKQGIILMQYTGLKDKNCKEIYEGDILEWTVYPDEVEPIKIRDEVSFGRGIFNLKKRGEILGTKNIEHLYEVIGNIHKNFELLK